MEKIRAIIVDDEPLAREGISMRLKQEPDIELIHECKNGREAVNVIMRNSPDLVFLDIQMPTLGGFGVIEAVGIKRMPDIIFVTAYDEHALQAFEVHALDYLLKPIDGDRFTRALERARNRIKGKNLEAITKQLQNMMAALKNERKYIERLSIKSADRIMFVSVNDIDWIEAAGNYVKIHVGRESHILHLTMNNIENRLDTSKFLRIHRSTIVNAERIKELHIMFHGEYQVVLKDGTKVTSSRSYKETLQKLVNNL
jgi:two-component system, LytTR family, response regulator